MRKLRNDFDLGYFTIETSQLNIETIIITR